jgi:iron-sulfur cluster assembly protein
MAITLTDTAAERVVGFLANRGSGLGIRLSVQTTGCSGLGYNMEFVDNANGDDTVFEDNGVKVIIVYSKALKSITKSTFSENNSK